MKCGSVHVTLQPNNKMHSIVPHSCIKDLTLTCITLHCITLEHYNVKLKVRFFGETRIRIFDPRSLGSWCIKVTNESLPRVDSSVSLIDHDSSDLGLRIRIQIFPKKHTLRLQQGKIIYRLDFRCCLESGLCSEQRLVMDPK